jgi:FtsH-binding integral membrane protein
MNADARAMLRPRKLVWITLALAVATLGVGLRWASPALSPSGVTHVPLWFDVLFGIGGAIGLAWAARRLWTHHRRDSRAAGFALLCWGALFAAVTARSALFAQADYERGRLPFFAIATLILLVLGAVMSTGRRIKSNKG